MKQLRRLAVESQLCPSISVRQPDIEANKVASNVRRRGFLATLLTGITGGVAGCAGNGREDSPSVEDEPSQPAIRQYSAVIDEKTEPVQVAIPESASRTAREGEPTVPTAVDAARSAEFLDSVARSITDRASSPVDALRAAQSFAAEIDYATDRDSTGSTEYIRKPAETLVDGKGDCDDKAVLLMGLLSRPPFNYRTGLITPFGHCAVLVARSDLPPGIDLQDPLTVQLDDIEYIYLESVAQTPPGQWARDYGERPLLAAYTDRWYLLDLEAVLESSRYALENDAFGLARRYV